jgi:hypothetical protein
MLIRIFPTQWQTIARGRLPSGPAAKVKLRLAMSKPGDIQRC